MHTFLLEEALSRHFFPTHNKKIYAEMSAPPGASEATLKQRRQITQVKKIQNIWLWQQQRQRATAGLKDLTGAELWMLNIVSIPQCYFKTHLRAHVCFSDHALIHWESEMPSPDSVHVKLITYHCISTCWYITAVIQVLNLLQGHGSLLGSTLLPRFKATPLNYFQ